MEKFLILLERYTTKIVGRVLVKGIGMPINGTALYTSAIQDMASTFQHFLEHLGDSGIMVLDSRNKGLNTSVSHSVFTQKFKSSGDACARILDMPIFGHSDNHAGLQAADLLCSAFLFPMATYTYCLGHVKNDHSHLTYRLIRDKFGPRIKKLQHRYQNDQGWWCGGVSIQDKINRQSSGLLFGPK